MTFARGLVQEITPADMSYDKDSVRGDKGDGWRCTAEDGEDGGAE